MSHNQASSNETEVACTRASMLDAFLQKCEDGLGLKESQEVQKLSSDVANRESPERDKLKAKK